nr:7TM diverse intracellular signaling domain-containing protein [Spirochaetota bacterium]
MKRIKFFIFLFFLTIGSYLFSSEFDFRTVSFTKDTLVELTGEWEFYYGKLLTPEDFCDFPEENAVLIKVPSVWNGSKNGKLPGFGFATYKTKIIAPKISQRWGLKIVNISSSFKIWVNGVLLYENGVVSEEKEKYIPSYRPALVDFGNEISEEGEFEVAIQVANFSHADGGIWDKIYFGKYETLELTTMRNLVIEGFLFGCMIIMALYHLILFFIRKKDRHYFHFALTAFFAGIGIISRTETIIYQFFPNFNANSLKIIQYVSYYLIGFFFALFIDEIYIKAENKIFFKIFYAATIFFTVLSFFLPIDLGFRILIIHCYILIAFLLYVIMNLLKMLIYKKPKAVLFLAGIIVLLIALTHDMLYILHFNDDGFWLIPGMAIYLFIQTVVISIDFINALNNEEILTMKLTNNNEELKDIIDEKIIYQKKLKSLNLKLANAERLERQKISQELHDSIVQLLGLSLMKIKKISPRIDNAEISEEISEIKDLLENSSNISRNLIFELHPRILYDLGLRTALEKIINDFKKSADIDIRLEYRIDFNPSDDVSFLIFANSREILVNAVKHSQCKNILIGIKYENSFIKVDIKDDGKGFDMDKYK